MSEKCHRCGSVGEDRRTLWMACFYAMSELGIPFERKILFDAPTESLTKAKEPTSIELKEGVKFNLTAGTVTCSGELTPQRFLYT